MWQRLYERGYHWIELYGPKLVIAVILLVAGQWIIRVLKKVFLRILHKKQTDSALRPFLASLITIVLQVLLLLLVMQLVGIKMTIFAALVGALGVAGGLALSGTLQNFTSGVLILLLKPYEIGDNIVAQGQNGIVDSIQLFYTVLITPDNRTVIIPNSKLSNEVIVNNTRQGLRRIDIELKLSYGISSSEAKRIALQELDQLQPAQAPAPEAAISGLDPDGWKLLVYAWVDNTQYDETRFALQEKIINNLKQHNIKLPGM
jgi:small conductance mechanosensitive channel